MRLLSLPSFLARVTGAVALVLALGAAPASAQLNLANQDSEAPLEIYAEQGVEWEQDNNRMIARGNARAERGTVVVRADMLIAYYSDTNASGGGTDIWRLEAVGGVRISSPNETVYGDTAVYDVEKAVVVVRGETLRLVSDTATITARDSLEYWETRRQMVARGNAKAVRDGQIIQADVLVANFAPGQSGGLALNTVDGYDNVRIESERETATGDRATYNVPKGTATLEGNVEIDRQGNILTGEYAAVDLKAGRSTLYASKPGSGGAAPAAGDKPAKKKQTRVKMTLKPRAQSGDGGDGGGN